MEERDARPSNPVWRPSGWVGASHFLIRTLNRVRTEVSLHILAYESEAIDQIFGVVPPVSVFRRLGSRAGTPQRIDRPLTRLLSASDGDGIHWVRNRRFSIFRPRAPNPE